MQNSLLMIWLTGVIEMNVIFKKSKGWLVLFVAPLILIFSIIIVIPLFQTLYYSFFEWNGIRTTAFRGLDNYKKLLQSRELGISLKNSIIYSLMLTIYQVGLGIVFSFILTSVKIKGRLIYRNIFFVPVLLSISVVAQLWIWIYNGDYGLINQLMDMLKIPWSQQWLNGIRTSLPAVAFVDAWKGMGYIMLIIYAAMRNVPDVYGEAAMIDGATAMQKLRYIILPLSAPVIRMTIVMCMTFGFRAFETTYLITGGGPGVSTYNLTILMYKAMFKINDYGYGSAIALVIVMICVGLMYLINRLTRRWA